jgi:hypothetical protein
VEEGNKAEDEEDNEGLALGSMLCARKSGRNTLGVQHTRTHTHAHAHVHAHCLLFLLEVIFCFRKIFNLGQPGLSVRKFAPLW